MYIRDQVDPNRFTEVTIKPDLADPSTWRTGAAILQADLHAFEINGGTPDEVDYQVGDWTFLCGTGELEGIHGDVGNVVNSGPNDGGNNYFAFIHFDDNEPDDFWKDQCKELDD